MATRSIGSRAGRAVAIVVSGAGIGWLLGLSASPVLHIVIASIMAIAGGVVATLANPPGRDDASTMARTLGASPAPLALLLAGIAVGSGAGIYARTNEVFVRPRAVIDRWVNLGLDRVRVTDALFEQLHPAATDGRANTGLLFGVSVRDCDFVRLQTGSALRARLETLDRKPLHAALERCSSDECLEALRDLICASDR